MVPLLPCPQFLGRSPTCPKATRLQGLPAIPPHLASLDPALNPHRSPSESFGTAGRPLRGQHPVGKNLGDPKLTPTQGSIPHTAQLGSPWGQSVT